MTLRERIHVFVQLHELLKSMPADERDYWHRQSKNHNGWFDASQVDRAIEGIIQYTAPKELERWLAAYNIPDAPRNRKVGLVMAGNIPLVGFHDLLCILLSGNIAWAKLSAQDAFLPKEMAKKLVAIDPRMEERIAFAERMNDVDALIATGSDNSARYFEYYFRAKPHIIRKNRSSVAILTGEESESDLRALGSDIYTYYGLGCRNVSKVLVPQGYDLTSLLWAVEDAGKEAMLNHKYQNNYDYNKSIYLVNRVPHLDNGSLMAVEQPNALVSPISVLYYETYRTAQEAKEWVVRHSDKLQCIVSKDGAWENSVPMGGSQRPHAWDYADGVDTIAFLLSL